MKPPTYTSGSSPRCLLSDPAQPHQLHRETDSPLAICYACKGEDLEKSKYHYHCATCDLEFHRGCHKFPPQIKHPAHISHLLSFISSDPKVNTSNLPFFWIDADSSDSESSINEDDDDDDDEVLSNEKCKCCGRYLGKVYYQCCICNFKLKPECVASPPPLTVTHHKSHEHTLTLFPRRLPLPCDACGESLEDIKDLVYACLPCNYMVHSKCIYLPRVIKITRHQHRLSYASSLSSNHVFSCGVCRKSVDINYGQYSCKDGCFYAVHSKCAIRKDVWDGKDLEGIPEEFEEDVEPFVRIDEETIQHFSHQQHYLKFHKNINTNICGETKYCEACCIPIPNSKDFYGCSQCEFFLDEECASLPRKKNHPLHKHPLTLQPIASKPLELMYRLSFEGMFDCGGCYKEGFGFVYECSEKDCLFQLDVRCASLPDPLIHGCHPQDHPLFFNLTRGKCMGCKSTICSKYYLECMQCKSFLGVKCATLPSLAHYKHDRHPLTLHYGEKGTTKEEYWCEICESKLDVETWFYTCYLCRVTLHVKCLLGEGIYMKPFHVVKIKDDGEVKIASNNGNSRPLCSRCHKRCQKVLIFFKGGDEYFCAWDCLLKTLISTKRLEMGYVCL